MVLRETDYTLFASKICSSMFGQNHIEDRPSGPEAAHVEEIVFLTFSRYVPSWSSASQRKTKATKFQEAFKFTKPQHVYVSAPSKMCGLLVYRCAYAGESTTVDVLALRAGTGHISSTESTWSAGVCEAMNSGNAKALHGCPDLRGAVATLPLPLHRQLLRCDHPGVSPPICASHEGVPHHSPQTQSWGKHESALCG